MSHRTSAPRKTLGIVAFLAGSLILVAVMVEIAGRFLPGHQNSSQETVESADAPIIPEVRRIDDTVTIEIGLFRRFTIQTGGSPEELDALAECLRKGLQGLPDTEYESRDRQQGLLGLVASEVEAAEVGENVSPIVDRCLQRSP